MMIFETKNFTIEAVEKPLITRIDGGHVVINPKVRVRERQELKPILAIELMRLTMIVGEAMTTVLNRNGVDVGRINYQDNGNWGVFKAEGPYCHIHIYGRAKSAKVQRFGHTLYFPLPEEHPEFYKGLEPLTDQDVRDMGAEIVRLLNEEKYGNPAWGISNN